MASTTPDVYLAEIVGAMQAKSAQPSVQSVETYLNKSQAGQLLTPTIVTSIQTYLKTPQAATTISDSIVIANRTIAWLKDHPKAAAPIAQHGTGVGRGLGVASAPIRQLDVTTAPQTPPGMSQGQAAAAAQGAAQVEEPGLEDDRLGEALVGIGIALVAGEAILPAIGVEVILQFLETNPGPNPTPGDGDGSSGNNPGGSDPHNDGGDSEGDGGSGSDKTVGDDGTETTVKEK